VPVPDAARPVEGAAAVLVALARPLLKVCILSSRSTQQLRRLLPVRGVELLGDYGIGTLRERDSQSLERFNAEARPLIRQWPGVLLEEKPASTSVHFRGSPGARPRIAASIVPLAERLGLVAAFGRQVLEVRPAAADKAAAVGRLVELVSPAGVIYLGDDENDRAVFELLPRLPIEHFSVGVASGEARRGLFAACDLVVAAPAAAVEFLSLLAGWARSAKAPRGPAAGDRSSG
jgi:trehalose-phosphatase